MREISILSILVFQLSSCLFSAPPSDATLHEAEVTCLCLQRVTCACVTDSSSLQRLREDLLPKCVSILVYGSMVESSETGRLVTNPTIIELVSSIVRTIVQELDSASAEGVMSNVMDMFLDGNLGYLDSAVQSSDARFQPLQVGGTDC